MASEKMEQNFEKPLNEKEEILNRIREFRFDFIDELPPELLLSQTPN